MRPGWDYEGFPDAPPPEGWVRSDREAHPDDEEGSKHRLICQGARGLAEEQGWGDAPIYLWIGASPCFGGVGGEKRGAPSLAASGASPPS